MSVWKTRDFQRTYEQFMEAKGKTQSFTITVHVTGKKMRGRWNWGIEVTEDELGIAAGAMAGWLYRAADAITGRSRDPLRITGLGRQERVSRRKPRTKIGESKHS